MSNEAWFCLEDATFRWGDRLVLDDVTLALDEPRLAWLSGPSGSGKTTLLRIAAGHHHLHAGVCRIMGTATNGPGPDRAFVFQDFKLFPWKTVFENVAAGPRFLGYSDCEVPGRVEPLLERAGLLDARDHWPHQLSGGMQQRVAILRSLAVSPRCLLVDEPFNALDEDSALNMWAMIEEYLSQSGAACLISSHNPRHVGKGGGHVIVFAGNGTLSVNGPAPSAEKILTRKASGGTLAAGRHSRESSQQ